jgi:hypothetical protein
VGGGGGRPGVGRTQSLVAPWRTRARDLQAKAWVPEQSSSSCRAAMAAARPAGGAREAEEPARQRRQRQPHGPPTCPALCSINLLSSTSSCCTSPQWCLLRRWHCRPVAAATWVAPPSLLMAPSRSIRPASTSRCWLGSRCCAAGRARAEPRRSGAAVHPCCALAAGWASCAGRSPQGRGTPPPAAGQQRLGAPWRRERGMRQRAQQQAAGPAAGPRRRPPLAAPAPSQRPAARAAGPAGPAGGRASRWPWPSPGLRPQCGSRPGT